MKSMQTTLKEVRLVEKIIKNDVVKEKTIKNLYKHIFKSNGKKIRSKLNLIASSVNRKKKNRIKLAAIIELLHTATLVHDDVVDDSSFRRGKESVNKLWSNAHGVSFDYAVIIASMLFVLKILKQSMTNSTTSSAVVILFGHF